MSTLSHTFETPRLRTMFRALDQGAIYLLIAATYTPFSMAYLHTTPWWIVLGLVWTIALWGFFSKVFFAYRVEQVSMWPCIVLGVHPVRLRAEPDRRGFARGVVVDAARRRLLHARPGVLGERSPGATISRSVAHVCDRWQRMSFCRHSAVCRAGSLRAAHRAEFLILSGTRWSPCVRTSDAQSLAAPWRNRRGKSMVWFPEDSTTERKR